MRRLARLTLAVTAIAAGCGDGVDVPPPAQSDCAGQQCPHRPPPVSNPGTGGSPNEPDAGTGGGDPAEMLSGSVLVFQGPDFVTVAEFPGDGEITAPGARGRVRASFSDGEYTLDGISATSPIWVDITAENTDDILPTVQQIDPREPTPDVAFVQRLVLEDIVDNFVAPTVLNAARAYAVIRFVDRNGLGVPNVQLTDHTGEVVAYDVGGGIFRDELEETTASGLALVVNAASVALPGSAATFAFETPTRNGTFTLHLARGAATLTAIDVGG